MTEAEIEDSFYSTLSFGTAGIRGELGLGTNKLNIYQVRRVIHGFGLYLKENKKKLIIVAHDNRHMSKEFVIETINVLEGLGISTLIFDGMRPTPLLSYAVRHLNAGGGVIITASHNPKEYNGIKLYDETGRQLIPEEIIPVAEKIDGLGYFDNSFDCVSPKFINKEVEVEYLKMVKSISLNKVEPIEAVFTPLHGTGGVFIKDILPNIYLVKEQMEADPNFSTVSLPNPEDVNAFDLAIKLGKRVNADILLATNPDADRVGCMIYDNGYQFLNGNEIAIILLNYILENKNLDNGIVYKSIVSSGLGNAICKKCGVKMEETLTGFKYIGKKMNETDKEFLFGYEESRGCIISDSVRDKDALQATYMLYEACSYYKSKGLTLLNVLENLYNEFGRYNNLTVSYTLRGQLGLKHKSMIMDYFRSNMISGALRKIDYLNETGLMKDDIVKFELDGGSVIIRPSGTEPKIKVYLESFSDTLKIDKLEEKISILIENIKGENDE
ncbi:phospho-sugar mutase [Mycoplasmatota bacterium zrk1]